MGDQDLATSGPNGHRITCSRNSPAGILNTHIDPFASDATMHVPSRDQSTDVPIICDSKKSECVNSPLCASKVATTGKPLEGHILQEATTLESGDQLTPELSTPTKDASPHVRIRSSPTSFRMRACLSVHPTNSDVPSGDHATPVIAGISGAVSVNCFDVTTIPLPTSTIRTVVFGPPIAICVPSGDQSRQLNAGTSSNRRTFWASQRLSECAADRKLRTAR